MFNFWSFKMDLASSRQKEFKSVGWHRLDSHLIYSEQNENPLMKIRSRKGPMSKTAGHHSNAWKTFVLKGESIRRASRKDYILTMRWGKAGQTLVFGEELNGNAEGGAKWKHYAQSWQYHSAKDVTTRKETKPKSHFHQRLKLLFSNSDSLESLCSLKPGIQ